MLGWWIASLGCSEWHMANKMTAMQQTPPRGDAIFPKTDEKKCNELNLIIPIPIETMDGFKTTSEYLYSNCCPGTATATTTTATIQMTKGKINLKPDVKQHSQARNNTIHQECMEACRPACLPGRMNESMNTCAFLDAVHQLVDRQSDTCTFYSLFIVFGTHGICLLLLLLFFGCIAHSNVGQKVKCCLSIAAMNAGQRIALQRLCWEVVMVVWLVLRFGHR